MEQLPIEIAASVLKFLDFNELIRICDTKLPMNFDCAIREKRVWKKKILNIKSGADVKKCLKNIENVKHCTKISFSSVNIQSADMLKLIHRIESIEHLFLDNFMEMDDEIMEEILHKHGKFLKHLSLRGCSYLTNYTLAQISKYCVNLRNLNISECSFSAAGLEILAENDKIVESLKILDISKCYLMDQGAILPLSKLKSLISLSLRNFEWPSVDNLLFILQSLEQLGKVDIRNCDDFTKQGIEQVKMSLRRPLEIVENTKLVDDTPESIRGYLMAMINAEIF